MRVNNAKRWIIIGIVLCGGLCGASPAPICASAQQSKHQWQRVYTGEDSIIEINSFAVTFQPDRILRAEFRTVFSKPATIGHGEAAVKYKTSLETIDFRMIDQRYRFFEIALLDTDGKVIQKKAADASVYWKVLKPGGINERLFHAACMLTPLGMWQVVDFRFADRNPKSIAVFDELDRLIGMRVHLHFDFAEVGSSVCSSPLYEEKDRTEEVAGELEVDWKAIGIKPELARAIKVRCEGSGWAQQQSLLVKDDREEMLMLWEGVFLVLKRATATEFHKPTLKRKAPSDTEQTQQPKLIKP